MATTDLPRLPGHPFYRKLHELLAEAGFDAWVEKLCEPYYGAGVGRPGIPPGIYFRMILVGYCEGIGSQRGIAWRCIDGRSLQDFLGVPRPQKPRTTPACRGCISGGRWRCIGRCCSCCGSPSRRNWSAGRQR